MNVIIAYLETMFSAYPARPRLLEAKAELQTMMEDAYHGYIAAGQSENEAVGRVITEFGNLDELAPVLGITNEIAPQTAADAAAEPASPVYAPLTVAEATGFAEAHHRTRFKLAIGVALFVLSPITLLLLSVAADNGLVRLSSGGAAAIGLSALFVLIAGGVLLMISISRDFSRYERIQQRRFSHSAEVTAWAEALTQQHDRRRLTALQFAIACWVLSPVPLLALALTNEGAPLEDFWSVLGVALVLVLVATGLLILLPHTWARTVYETVTGPTDRAGRKGHRGGDDDSSVISVIAPIYWPLAVVIYLGWSFIWDAWDISWLVWPIAGLLFGALAGGIGAWEHRRRVMRR